MFRRRIAHTPIYLSTSEAKLNTIVDLVKDLSKSDYNRLRDGMDLIYNGYQKIRNAKTSEEKELSDVNDLERLIDETTK